METEVTDGFLEVNGPLEPTPFDLKEPLPPAIHRRCVEYLPLPMFEPEMNLRK